MLDSQFLKYCCNSDHLGKLPVSIMEAVVLRKCKLRILVENSQLPSSVIISRPFRLHMYRILGIFPVSEIFRHDFHSELFPIHMFVVQLRHKLQVFSLEGFFMEKIGSSKETKSLIHMHALSFA